MQELDTLRLYVRNVLRNIKSQQKKELRNEINEERSLRKTIRRLLREKQDTTQFNSTGINALEKLLSSIVPILETGYKDLKTAPEQRKSFQAHILRAIQGLLSTVSVNFAADKKAASGAATASPALAKPPEGELKEQGEQPEPGTPEADPNFIDIDKEKKAKEQKPNPTAAFQTISGEDLTGRNFALETFKKIQKQIVETYSLLSNDQDREIFYDYLLTNVKLYFRKFETELEATPAEPTTPEYEAEIAKQDAALQGAQPAAAPAEVPPAPEAGATPETPEAPPAA